MMDSSLLALAFGPVQSFIATARRTRDLWFGSWLLSEISKAGALALLEHARAQGRPDAVTLIFPHADAAALAPDNSSLSVANKIVARIADTDPRSYAEAAKTGAIARWHALAEECGQTFGWQHIDTTVWALQAKPRAGMPDDLVECYAAWVALEGDYASAMTRLQTLLAARKATRNFAPAATEPESTPGFGRKKSSLDGQRESVLKSPDAARLRRFGIDAGEQLDAPGLVKRVLGNRDKSFTALARVACEPWVQRMRKLRLDDQLEAIGKLYEKLRQRELATRAYRYKDFCYDAQLIYDFRAEQFLQSTDDRDSADIVRQLLRIMRTPGLPRPDAYVAVLAADGDGMGKLISHPSVTIEQHRELSAQLAAFAADVPKHVADEGGECVYAGGDDVLAFLPAATALRCARRLADAFTAKMRGLRWVAALPPAEQATLSVGVAYGHVLTPLATLRRLAGRAEQLPKQGQQPGDIPRNALGVVISPRSGSVLELRGRWDDGADGLFGSAGGFDARLQFWTGCFADGSLSSRAGYQLRRLEAELRRQPAALAAEASRLVARKGERGTALIAATRAFMGRYGIDQLHREWIAARWLAAHDEAPLP